MKKILFAAIALLFSIGTALAQEQLSPEEKEKKLDEYIQKQVERLESSLKLEDWQTFYADSILNHDYHALQEELNALQGAKVSNADLTPRQATDGPRRFTRPCTVSLMRNSGQNTSKQGLPGRRKPGTKGK